MNVRHVGRFEWEQILRRARLSGLITGSGKLGKNGRPTKGGVSGTAFMAIALTFATYGDLPGDRIYPGDAEVAVSAEASIDTVAKVRRKLTELGMLDLVKPARGRSYWQLSIPVETPDELVVLTPAAQKMAAKKLRDGARGFGKGGSTGTPTSSVSDAVQDGAPYEKGGPVDPPFEDSPETPGGSGGPPGFAKGGSVGGKKGGPLEGLTKPRPDQQLHQANSDDDLCTDVTGSRATDREQDPNLAVVKPEREPCPHGRPRRLNRRGVPRCEQCRAGHAQADDTPTGEPDTASETTAAVVNLSPPKCQHGLSAGRRKDNTPACALCRVAERKAA